MRLFLPLLTLGSGLLLLACDKGGFKPGGKADFDRDGYGAPVDCDDLSSAINPDAVEVCDGVDNDCDGQVDEADAEDASTFYADADGDGFGAAAYPRLGCAPPSGHVANADDCDDSDDRVSPEADERCNESDDDCDGDIDEDAVDAVTWYLDEDGDGYGVDEETTLACSGSEPSGYASRRNDCDDTDSEVNPGEDEVWYDGVDADCDGADDYDADADGYASDEHGGEDCDDERPQISPAATERCNDYDDDCDGEIDEEGSVGESTVWQDADGDGQGDPDVEQVSCESAEGWVGNSDDCDDSDPEVFLGASETWYDGVDGDCDGLSDYDADGDGYDSDLYGGGDCDDTDAATAPTEWYPDVDGDGYGDEDGEIVSCEAIPDHTTVGGDCDDGDADVSPGEVEVCGNGIDDDCDGTAKGCSLEGEFSDSDHDLRLQGSDTYDTFGVCLALGDLDGDGVEDLVLGAPEDATTTNPGGAWVQLGPLSSSGDADEGLGVQGEDNGDRVGHVLAVLDLDGDGFDDLAVGAPGASALASGGGGAAVFLGPLSGVSSFSDGLLHVDGDSNNEQLGASLAGVPDLDGDGLDELLVGSAGNDGGETNGGGVFLFTGSSSGALTVDDAHATLLGSEFRGAMGSTVAGLSDLDGDGLAELVAVEGLGDGEDTDSGVAWIFSGPVSGNLSTGDATASVSGLASNDDMGAALVAADLDDDGLDDLIIAARGMDSTDPNSGRVYVLTGALSGAIDLSGAAATVDGVNSGDKLGESLAAGGDFDADGQADLWVATSRHDTSSLRVGGAWLFLGPVSGGLDVSDADGSIEGSTTGQELGTSMVWADSLSGSGHDELLLGMPGDSGGAVEAGAAVLFAGGEGL